MCGIFGYVGYRENASQIVLDGLKFLEYRGYDSWGVAVVPSGQNPKNQRSKDPNKIIVKKRIGKIGDANVDELPKSFFGLGHTRWATHGGVSEKNAHPHLDCTGEIAVIHNGIIENYDLLKKKLTSHRFKSETDTEVAVHLIENYSKKYSFPDAVRQTFLAFKGLNALIAFNTNSEEFVAIRNGSPLVVGFGREENFIASDAAALVPHTRDVYFMEDDEMVVVGRTLFKLFDAKSGREKKFKKTTLTWNIDSVEKGQFEHFMLKEISEQPNLVATIAANGELQAVKLAKLIKESYGTYFIGCGSASYACIVASYLFSKIAKFHVNSAIGSEFSYHLDFLTRKSLIVALSQSGETMDILESVKEARNRGATIASLTNVLGSTLYRISDEKFLIGAGPEKGVASTKAFIGKLSYMLLTAFALKGKVKQGQRLLRLAALASQQLVSDSNIERIKHLAQKVHKKKDIYVIGRGLSFPASLEAALKIKEISYIHAEGLAAGELKHGPLALITKGTPCIVFAPVDETHGANLAGAMEMKARGGYIIGISPKPHEVFDYYIPVDDCGEATIIPSIIVSQLLAYYLAVIKNLDPDKPRNLAKSVTVK